MHCRAFLIMLSVAVLGTTLPVVAAQSQSGNSGLAFKQAGQNPSKPAKKNSSVKKKRSQRSIAHRLIPPPPAYMPSILPELYFKGNPSSATEAEENEIVAGKPSNPYAKYFYSRDNEVPKAVQVRSGVTTWQSTP